MNDELSLEALRIDIVGKNVNWKANITSVSGLSIEEKKRRLGLIPTSGQLTQMSRLGLDTESTSRYLKQSPHIESGYKASVDWRSVNNSNWITPVKDQGSCGSCVAFGTIAALEALLRIRLYRDVYKDLDLSEAHLLWCGGGSCNGWYMDDACDYLKNNGIPDEACFPYTDNPMNCSYTCSDWKKWIGDTKIQEWSNTTDIKEMKENLINNGPQITGMAVYDDFFYYSSGIYKHISGSLAGYHCICVVGYDDDEGCWICKNSWGTGWGENGFFRIAYGECGISDVFGMWNIKVKTAEEEEDGFAEQISIEYSWISSEGILCAYAGGNWRHIQISNEDMTGIARLVFDASKVYIGWKGDQLTFVRCYK